LKTKRDEFSQATARLIASRAAYVCSKPGCRKPTTAAGTSANEAVSIGVAAHICAAAPGGPRYDATQTPKERCSEANGIWLCQDHARLVDVDDPATYSIEILRQWKADHIARMRAELEHGPSRQLAEVSGEHVARGVGTVTALRVQGPAIIRPGTRVLAEGEGIITATHIG
jgi:hypothetical protein